MNNLLRGTHFQRFLIVACLLAANALHARQPIDLRIIIDISGEVRGSMPARQHLDAVAMLLDQLPADSMAGIWTFGRYTNHLVTYGRVDAQWRALAAEKLPTIRSVASWRDIARALDDATFDKARPVTGYRRVVLLLSAGGVNISDEPEVNSEVQQQLLARQVGPLRAAGIEIHTVALNNGQGTAFLSALAKESNGMFFAVSQPAQVHAALARIADSLRPLNSTPLERDGFAIDTAIERFSAVLVGDPGRLAIESPSGRMEAAGNSKQRITRHDGTHHVRIDVEAPEMGRWRLRGSAGTGSRIYVESNQAISLAPIPDRVVSGDNIAVVVNVPVPQGAQAAYQTPVDVTLEVVDLAGTETFIQQLQVDPVNSGRYTVEVPGLIRADNYQLKVTFQALDYSREVMHTLQVHDLLDLDVLAGVEAGESVYTLTAQAADTELDLGQTRLSVKVTDSAGETAMATLQAEQGVWRFNVADDGVSSEYRLDLALVGTTISGRTVNYTPRPLVITLPERPDIISFAGEAPGQELLEPDAEVAEVVPVVEKSSAEASGTAENSGQSLLLIVLAAGCIVVGAGLSGWYLWLRRRAPYRIDLARDAAAYRLANNISIVRMQESGRPFQQVAGGAVAQSSDGRADMLEPRIPASDDARENAATTEPAAVVPLLDDIAPAGDTAGVTAEGVIGQDDLPEDTGAGLQEAEQIMPGELLPEDLSSPARNHEVTPADEEEQRATGDAAGAVLVEQAPERSIEEPILPVAEHATAAGAGVSITRLSEPEISLADPDDIPDFETVDAALSEEIAADTALIEETELASEWDNVAILGPRSTKVDAVDPVAEELAGEDPFADYRTEYEARQGKESG